MQAIWCVTQTPRHASSSRVLQQQKTVAVQQSSICIRRSRKPARYGGYCMTQLRWVLARALQLPSQPRWLVSEGPSGSNAQTGCGSVLQATTTNTPIP